MQGFDARGLIQVDSCRRFDAGGLLQGRIAAGVCCRGLVKRVSARVPAKVISAGGNL